MTHAPYDIRVHVCIPLLLVVAVKQQNCESRVEKLLGASYLMYPPGRMHRPLIALPPPPPLTHPTHNFLQVGGTDAGYLLETTSYQTEADAVAGECFQHLMRPLPAERCMHASCASLPPLQPPFLPAHGSQ